MVGVGRCLTTCVQEYDEPVRAAAAGGEDVPRARPGRKVEGHSPREMALRELVGKARQALWLANGCFYDGQSLGTNATGAAWVPKYLGR